MSRFLSVGQKIEIIKEYHQKPASLIATEFNERYPGRQFQLNERTVRRIVKKFNENGTVERKKSGARKCKSRCPEINQQIARIFEDNVHTSLSQAHRDTGLDVKTIRKCLKSQNFRPYKFARAFEQKRSVDLFDRVEYCTAILQEIEKDPAFLSRIIWSDESLFLLCGLPNKQNYR